MGLGLAPHVGLKARNQSCL